jgi:phosphatidylethanolamine/phosphatidyl-N-methylethanolamine N-methyltransferase
MLRDESHFFRSLVVKPRLIGAVAPSGRALARAMATAAGEAARGLVIELGPGTGPVTRALIERGIERERLVLVEYDSRFCHMLAQRFGAQGIIQGDAYDLPRTLQRFAGQPIAAVVSSLPLLNQPPHRRETLVDDAFTLMGPDGRFVQFTYGFLSPIPHEFCAGRFSAHGSAPIWRNLPPARVWTYRLDSDPARNEAALLKGRSERASVDRAPKAR